MAAAIARIYGHNIHSDRVRTFVVAALVGDSLKDIAKASGIAIGRGLAKSLIEKVPGRALIEFNKRVGFRLLTKAGEKGAINLMKGVPFVGGASEEPSMLLRVASSGVTLEHCLREIVNGSERSGVALARERTR